MTERIHIPAGRLAAFAQFLWYSDGYWPASTRERVLPTGYTELVFNLDGVPFRDFDGGCRTRSRELGTAVVSGVSADYSVIDSTRRRATMGAMLRPGAARALMGIPATALSGDTHALGDVYGADMVGLGQRLRAAGTMEDRLRLLESWLSQRLDPAARTSPAILTAVEAWEGASGRTSVSEMVQHSGFSRRRFVDLFKDAVGVAPKTFIRLRRFQQVVVRAQSGTVADWAQLALETGYSDQAHLIQEFRGFSGMTPAAYARAEPIEPNHLPLPSRD